MRAWYYKGMTLNYTALTQPVPIRSRLRAAWGKGAVACAGLSLLGTLGIIVIFLLDGFNSSIALLFILTIMCGIIATVGYFQAARHVRLQWFAEENSITYRQNLTYDGRPGIFFNTGHSRRFTESLIFPKPHAFEIGNYSYTIGSGKSRRTHLMGYVQLALPRRLPHMVLDSKKNNLFGHFSNIPYGFTGDQRLSLEGDFDEYFTLFAPASYKRDALYVFTPDVMQLLMTNASGFDIEIIDDTLYLYSEAPFEFAVQSHLEPLIQVAMAFSDKFSRRTGYYADEHVGDREKNVIATPGARLRTRMPALLGLTCIFFALYIIFLLV